jgi:hypothetical protein
LRRPARNDTLGRVTRFRFAVPLFAITAAAALLAGCFNTRAFIREGNANSVEIGFPGDLSDAWPLARKHCAQFEKVPKLLEADEETALFDCRKP